MFLEVGPKCFLSAGSGRCRGLVHSGWLLLRAGAGPRGRQGDATRNLAWGLAASAGGQAGGLVGPGPGPGGSWGLAWAGASGSDLRPFFARPSGLAPLQPVLTFTHPSKCPTPRYEPPSIASDMPNAVLVLPVLGVEADFGSDRLTRFRVLAPRPPALARTHHKILRLLLVPSPTRLSTPAGTLPRLRMMVTWLELQFANGLHGFCVVVAAQRRAARADLRVGLGWSLAHLPHSVLGPPQGWTHRHQGTPLQGQ